MSTLRIGIDAGGTFTDFVVVDDRGRISSFKLRSNPKDPSAVILAGLEQAASNTKADVIHGSTVATNALLERKGARTALVTTEGFEDLVQIGRQNRPKLYELRPVPPTPLVPRNLCYGVGERTFHDGERAMVPAAGDLRKLRGRLSRSGVEAVAICFLHSYISPDNERQVADALEGVGYVCCSHEVSPEFREYERSSTTVINAYVGPLMERYLARLERASHHRISILQSNGGSMTMAEARAQAVRTVLSGPAGGVVGARALADLEKIDRLIGFDMGGTSTDVHLVDGAPVETTESLIDGLPIRTPMLDIKTVGAGGGSIARVDRGGLLRVGPESAGADPGPACYGIGREATVTDAHVVLGRIASGQFLGGGMQIHEHRSGEAVDRLAASLGFDRTRAASGIVKVADANMQRAIRAVTVERGYDPKRFALVAFGGCGGLHACEIARELGIRTVVVPEQAGVLSAVGMLLADRIRDYADGALGRTDLESRFQKLERQALKETPGARLTRSADVRYAGQSYELTVPWDSADPGAPFHREHHRSYGYSDPVKPIEIVTIRVRSRRVSDRPGLSTRRKTGPAKPTIRRVYTDGRWRRIAVRRREELTSRWQQGPGLVLDYGSTTLIPPEWTFRRSHAGNLVAVFRDPNRK